MAKLTGWPNVTNTKSISSGYAVVGADQGSILNVTATAGDITISLASVMALGNGFRIWIRRESASTHNVIIDPAGGETIDGDLTVTLSEPNEAIEIISNGTNWQKGVISVDYTCMAIPYGRSPDVDEVIFNGHYFLDNITIVKLGIHGTKPGTNLTVDLLKDDVEQTRIATLSAGSSDEETDITDIDYLTTEKFGMVCKSIGSPEPGEIYSITVFYKKKS